MLAARQALLLPALVTLPSGQKVVETSLVSNAFGVLTDTGSPQSEASKRRRSWAGRIVAIAIQHALLPTEQGDKWLKRAFLDVGPSLDDERCFFLECVLAGKAPEWRIVRKAGAKKFEEIKPELLKKERARLKGRRGLQRCGGASLDLSWSIWGLAQRREPNVSNRSGREYV